MRSRAFWLVLVGLVAGAAACGGFVLLRPAVEAEARSRVERAARRAGLSTTIGSIRLTPWLTLELRDLVLENAGRVRVMTRAATVRPRLSFRVAPGRTARVSLGRTVVELPAGVRLELAPSTWTVESASPVLRARRLQAGERLELDVRRGPGTVELQAHATNARLSPLLRILVHGCPIADPGTIDGDARVERDPSGAVRLAVRARARAIAVATWATGGGGEGCDDASLGAPTDAELEAEARLEPAAGSLRADRLRLVAGGAEVRGSLSVDGGLADPRVELEVRVPRVDLARLLATAGLDLPAEDMGWASLTAAVSGPLLDPAALVVDERLDFTPPARPLALIERLRGPFVHRAESREGDATLVRVGPDSADFIPLADVPPLLVRTLLLGEDANFYGHQGVDLKELPVAMARNLATGTFARGASTIPQQLAKNLFLSREKTVSRKLEELALALLLDSSLGKDRVLEIYLNVIEWGPRVHGLRPAARHYFGREPADLTPKQMAFLVALIPGPLKYQRSFAGGTPTPFFEGLMASLLAKLHAVGALGLEEYQLALADPLGLRVQPSVSTGPDRIPHWSPAMTATVAPAETSFPKSQIRVLLLENVHASAREIFRQEGFPVEACAGALPEDALVEKVRDVHVLGIRSRTQVSDAVLSGARRLLTLGAFCIGTNQVALDAASERGVPVFNAPFSNTRSVAELVIAEIIALARRLADRSREMHEGRWRKGAPSSYEVRGKTLGIVGYGHIGTQVGVLAEAFGMQVLFHDIAPKLPMGNNRSAESLEAVLAQADFVTLHVPETPLTRGLVGERELARMKPGAYLLNLSRGSVVDVGALARALRSGHLSGAAADVFPAEPDGNTDDFATELRGVPNVILTPHVAGSTEEAQEAIGREVATALVKFVNTGATTGSVNFPHVEPPPLRDRHRLLNVHRNVPGVLSRINRIVSDAQANIESQILATTPAIGYLVMDLNREVSGEVRQQMSALETSIRTRVLY